MRLARVRAKGRLSSEPARGFLGFVEPAFDWTLKQPATEQFLTAGLVSDPGRHDAMVMFAAIVVK
ncbi:MAG: hypothetical protein M3436_10375 [Pseudomonadota bacterium]|nr:hypothetical protein [Pseudomonadota bacterium]